MAIEDMIEETKQLLTTIIDMSGNIENLEKIQFMAKRGLQLLKKISKIDKRSAAALEGKLRLILAATQKSMKSIRPNANAGIVFIESLENKYLEKIIRKAKISRRALKRGEIKTYGRFMTKREHRRLRQVKELESAEEGEMIPAFEATTTVMENFLKWEQQALRNIYSQIGGTGGADFIVFFKTDVVPISVSSSRKDWIFEVKFPNNTPVEIVTVRKL